MFPVVGEGGGKNFVNSLTADVVRINFRQRLWQQQREADLRLDLREAAIESGAIIPGEPDKSDLIARVFSHDEDAVMPPSDANKTLTAQQKELLKRWIAEGAPYEKHWALIAPTTPALPELQDASWAKNEIDRFVLERLQREGLSPAKEADSRKLFRRLHLDITGLPPSSADVDAFVADYTTSRDAALSQWVDRLMKLEAWGEHRGRFWLDAARYADTHGMHFDNYREMWLYRDWVIRSFNRNQPFDQFTIEQLAGDLLENPSIDQRIATGFQRCAMTTNEGGTIDEENLAVYAADRVQTFGWTYLGLTTNFCQCHDHKFDPLTMEDFYSLAAFFRNTTQPAKDGNSKDGRGPILRVPPEADRARWESIDGEIAAAKKSLADHRTAAQEPFRVWLAATSADSLRQDIPVDGRLVSLPITEGQGNTVAAIGAPDQAPVVASGDSSWIKQGKIGPAIQLKTGSTLNLGTLGDFSLEQPFSHAEWIRTSNPKQAAGIIARMDEKNKHRGWDLFIANGQLAMHLVDSWPDNLIKVSTQQPVIKKNTWHHVCVVWDGSGKPEGVTIYVDGNKQATRTDTNTLKPDADIRTETPLRIGQRSEGAVFEGGSVQDVHFFNRVLTVDEVGRLRDTELFATLLEKAADQRTDAEQASLLEYYLNHHDAAFPKLVAAVSQLEAERGSIESRSPITLVQVERADRPAKANILMRGQYDQVGAEVTAAPPESLHPFAADAPKNRLGLAQWVVDPANPLTARVTVNRFWQEIFEQGIVVTPEDFGVMGTPPTHPELLDWLATDFVANGWDVKRLFKQVLMSATYRQAAVTTKDKLAKDLNNALFSRGPRFRMDAEMVRDYALSVSGLRSSKMYGPGVRPYQPTGIWDSVGVPGGDTRNYKQDSGDSLYRRSLYMFWKRMVPPPGLEAFNAPSREVCTVRRERTNTPLQALVTLNGPQYVEAARKLAELAIKEAGVDDRRIMDVVARRVLCRSLIERELQLAMATHVDFMTYYTNNPKDANALLAFGDLPVDASLDPAQLAAWTMTCNQLMNLDEALNK
ncbi:MAG: DUF1553 domain-containing protein [Fuerstiella sp.]